MIWGRKWTILRAFLGESGLFCAFLERKWTILVKIVDNFGHFWTTFEPLAPPLATGLIVLVNSHQR